MCASVTELWRYPVKSAAGERVASFPVGPTGPLGDRGWGVVETDGVVVSAKHPARGGRLLDVSARYADDEGVVWLETPSCDPVQAGTAEADRALSDWLGRPVSLRSTIEPGVRLRRLWPSEREELGDWQADATPGTEAVTPMTGAERNGTFVDFGALHLISAGALERLARGHGTGVSARRFRPNIVTSWDEDPEPGAVVHIGDAVLRVEIPTPRCVVPGLAHPGVGADRALLRTLARRHRVPVADMGRAPCFGFYAKVEKPGAVWEGAAVT